MDKFVKLEAIAKLAKPMAALHGKDDAEEGPEMEEHECKCSCCGAPCEMCEDTDPEQEEDDEEY